MHCTLSTAPQLFSPRSLDHVFELIEGLGRRLRIQRVHGREQLVGDTRVYYRREGVVDVHDLGGRHRCNDAAQRRVDSLVVGRRCHALGSTLPMALWWASA